MEMTNIQSHASHTKNINNHDNNHPFKTLPFAPGEKEKLICEKRRANRLERLKQVRQIEKVRYRNFFMLHPASKVIEQKLSMMAHSF